MADIAALQLDTLLLDVSDPAVALVTLNRPEGRKP